jgi:MFS transporter, putative metabolite:H+ symporter
VFGRKYGPRTLLLSVFQFMQTIGVYGFSTWAAVLLADRGFSVVKTLGFTFLIACFTPLGGVLAWLLVAHGTIGVFTFIGAAMLIIVVIVGLWGPNTNQLRLEDLSP